MDSIVIFFLQDLLMVHILMVFPLPSALLVNMYGAMLLGTVKLVPIKVQTWSTVLVLNTMVLDPNLLLKNITTVSLVLLINLA